MCGKQRGSCNWYDSDMCMMRKLAEKTTIRIHNTYRHLSTNWSDDQSTRIMAVCQHVPKKYFIRSVCDSNKSVQKTLEQRSSRVFFTQSNELYICGSFFFLFLQRINVISSRLPLCNQELVQKHSRSDPLIKCDRTLVVFVVVVTFELISSCCALRFDLTKKKRFLSGFDALCGKVSWLFSVELEYLHGTN